MFKKIILSFCFLGLLNVFYIRSVSFSGPDQMLSFLKKYLPDNPIILESGGYCGKDTRRMKTVWDNSVIHVFEALPSSCDKIMANIVDLKNVFLYPYALTTYVGKADFYVNTNNNGASSINSPVDYNEDSFEKDPIKVNCITLDAWSKEYNIPKVDFMWLDMEGHELYVLQNALSLLDSVKAIYTEICFVPIRQGACLYGDLKKFLEANGFKEIWKRSCGRFGDALFIR